MTPRPRARASSSPTALLVVLTIVTLVSSGAVALDEDAPDDRDAVLVERQAYLMGTRALLATRAASRASGLAVLDRMLSVIESTERELSTWRDASLLGQLNHHPVGMPFAAPSWLCGLFEELRFWHDETNGAFDPAIGSLVEVWDLRRRGRIPSPDARALARSRAGIQFFDTTSSSSSCVVTRRSEATIDAGAFGKGFALDRVAATDTAGTWLADLGGQVAVGSASSGGRHVALAHPAERDRPVVELWLDRGSLAVSGGSERDRRVDDVQVGHILDPRTGRPVSRGLSVAVWHPRAMVADILATALYVMGADEGLAWAEARGLAVCFLLPVTAEEPSAGSRGVELAATAAFTRRFL